MCILGDNISGTGVIVLQYRNSELITKSTIKANPFPPRREVDPWDGLPTGAHRWGYPDLTIIITIKALYYKSSRLGGGRIPG